MIPRSFLFTTSLISVALTLLALIAVSFSVGQCMNSKDESINNTKEGVNASQCDIYQVSMAIISVAALFIVVIVLIITLIAETMRLIDLNHEKQKYQQFDPAVKS